MHTTLRAVPTNDVSWNFISELKIQRRPNTSSAKDNIFYDSSKNYTSTNSTSLASNNKDNNNCLKFNSSVSDRYTSSLNKNGFWTKGNITDVKFKFVDASGGDYGEYKININGTNNIGYSMTPYKFAIYDLSYRAPSLDSLYANWTKCTIKNDPDITWNCGISNVSANNTVLVTCKIMNLGPPHTNGYGFYRSDKQQYQIYNDGVGISSSPGYLLIDDNDFGISDSTNSGHTIEYNQTEITNFNIKTTNTHYLNDNTAYLNIILYNINGYGGKKKYILKDTENDKNSTDFNSSSLGSKRIDSPTGAIGDLSGVSPSTTLWSQTHRHDEDLPDHELIVYDGKIRGGYDNTYYKNWNTSDSTNSINQFTNSSYESKTDASTYGTYRYATFNITQSKTGENTIIPLNSAKFYLYLTNTKEGNITSADFINKKIYFEFNFSGSTSWISKEPSDVSTPTGSSETKIEYLLTTSNASAINSIYVRMAIKSDYTINVSNITMDNT